MKKSNETLDCGTFLYEFTLNTNVVVPTGLNSLYPES